MMGGQACVFYGAAQFSRDVDFAVLCDVENLQRLAEALRHLDAERVAAPPLEADYPRRAHAVHFRCHCPEAAQLRIDVMSTMRGVDPFPDLWERRTTLTDSGDKSLIVRSLTRVLPVCVTCTTTGIWNFAEVSLLIHALRRCLEVVVSSVW